MPEDLQHATTGPPSGLASGSSDEKPSRIRSSRRVSRAQYRYNPIRTSTDTLPRASSSTADAPSSEAPGSCRMISPIGEIEEGLGVLIAASETAINNDSHPTTIEIGLEDEQERGALEGLRAIIERQKRQLRSKAKSLERAKEEVAQLKQLRDEIQQELDNKEEQLADSKKNEEQYRNWWLNEIQFMKLLLNKIPNPNRDINLVRASQAHYLGHY